MQGWQNQQAYRDTAISSNLGLLKGWTHVALVFQTNYNYFVNGQAVPSQNHNHEPELRQNTEIDLGILNGRLDEFRIYDRALSDVEIELLHQSVQ